MGTVFLPAGRIEMVALASYLQPGQFSLGWLHIRSVCLVSPNIPCDFLVVLWKEPMVHKEERRLGLGYILMEMSNVSLQVLRILLSSKKSTYREIGGLVLLETFSLG